MEYMAYPAFLFYLALVIIGGIAAVNSPSLVRALVGLILTLFGVAGMYLLMSAPFIALMQILIYVGAVSVLIFFAVMLTGSSAGDAGSEEVPKYGPKTFFALLSGLFPAFVMGFALLSHPPDKVPLKPETTLGALGEFLLGPYVLPFELISVVLFAAMAGAVLIGFEKRQAK